MSEPIEYLELPLPRCGLTHGTAPCTASGTPKCYNTFTTCQDRENFAEGEAVIHRFAMQQEGAAHGAMPALRAVSDSSVKIDPDKGFGLSASLTAVLTDFALHDRAQDPYWRERTAQGTWLARLIAHNRENYFRRSCDVLRGHVGDAIEDMQRECYLLESIDGPDSNGRVQIKAKDPILKFDDAMLPDPEAVYTVAADFDDQATSIVTTGRDPVLGELVLRIGSELIRGEFKNTPVFLVTERGAFGSEADSHSAGDDLQVCYVAEDRPAIDVLRDLRAAADMDAFADDAQWADEADQWLTLSLTHVVSKPTKVKKLLEAVLEQIRAYMWWEQRQQRIVLKAIAPLAYNDVPPAYNRVQHVLADSFDLMDDLTKQITRVIVYFSPSDRTELGEAKNYRSISVTVDAEAELPESYGREKTVEIFADWLESAGDASSLGFRKLARYRNGERRFKWAFDPKDGAIWTGEILDITHPAVVGGQGDYSGAPTAARVQVIRAVSDGERIQYEGVTSEFTGRYAYFAPDSGVPDYDAASDEEQLRYGFYSDDNGVVGAADDAPYRYV